MSPTFARFQPDASSAADHSVQSVGNETSVSPTFNSPPSARNSVFMLSNVKLQAVTPKILAVELDASNVGGTASKFLAFNEEVSHVDCPIVESTSAPTAADAVQTVSASFVAASELGAISGPSRPIPLPKPGAAWGDKYSSYNHLTDGCVTVFESPAQVNLLVSSAQSLDELNARTMRSLMQHRLVESAPNLTQIFVPVSSSLAYVLSDLNAGPAALGRRFSDSINQLRPELELPISPRKVSQGKCLKVILLEPPQLQISGLFSYNSLCTHECFLYMNTESTVEIQSCRYVSLQTSTNIGHATAAINCLPSRLSMNDFLHLSGTICAWNRQSQDHVCCILMDVVHGARMSALLLGMLSLALGQCSDAEEVQKWLESKGDRCPTLCVHAKND